MGWRRIGLAVRLGPGPSRSRGSRSVTPKAYQLIEGVSTCQRTLATPGMPGSSGSDFERDSRFFWMANAEAWIVGVIRHCQFVKNQTSVPQGPDVCRCRPTICQPRKLCVGANPLNINKGPLWHEPCAVTIPVRCGKATPDLRRKVGTRSGNVVVTAMEQCVRSTPSRCFRVVRFPVRTV